MENPVVVIDEGDTSELYFMLRGRGQSALKTKLLAALEYFDPKSANELKENEDKTTFFLRFTP